MGICCLTNREYLPPAVLPRSLGLGWLHVQQQAAAQLFNWCNYVTPDTLSNFEAEFGVRICYAIYESDEEMLARVMNFNSGWDLVFPCNNFTRPMRANGLLAPLKHDRQGNPDSLNRVFHSPPWDLKLEWSVPYLWGATGVTFRQENSSRLAAWADLWPSDLRERLTMLDHPAEVLDAWRARVPRIKSA